MNDVSTATPPITAAAIDIGSNALRLLVVKSENGRGYVTLDSRRVSLRLGREVFLTGRLGQTALAKAMEALAEFKVRATELGATLMRAVATSAVRESIDGVLLVKRAAKELGLTVEVISGTEEARLVFRAVRERLSLEGEGWLLADLGGGSLELSEIGGEGIRWTESYPIGSVRILAELGENGLEAWELDKLVEESVEPLRLPAAGAATRRSGLIATGGNIETLAKLCGADERETGTSVISVGQLRAAVETLSRLSYRERVAMLHLREDRADVILPAAYVYLRLAELAGIDKIVVPFVGVKEGLVMEIIEESTGRSKETRVRAERTWDASLSLGRKYLFEEPHAVQVGRLALVLFDGLRLLHKLDENDRLVLIAAALLHDVGTFVGVEKHHKHSFYLISQAELPELSPGQMLLAALVARYHRKSDPSSKHTPFGRLSAADQTRVLRLAALLRLADALDREHLQKVHELRIELGPEVVILIVESSDDLLLERWSVHKKSKLFTRLFKLAVHLQMAKAVSQS